MNKKRLKKVLIYGGAFNPPHVGHAIAIESIIRLFSCDEIWIMPSASRRDKKIGVSGEHRLNMLKFMVNKFFPHPPIPIKFLSLEINRPKLTTTYDTHHELQRQYPYYEFYFLIGSDLLSEIKNKWVHGKEVYRSINFVAIKKPDVKLPRYLPKNITILDKNVTWVEVSSTFIRGLLSKSYFGVPYLTQKVANYIKTHHLYRE